MLDSQTPSRLVQWTALAAAGVLGVIGAGWWMARAPRTTPAVTAATTAPARPAAAEARLGAQATLSSAVVQAMVAGNAALDRGTVPDLMQARAAFEQAVKLDERYAPAHAGLTHALVRLAEAGADRPSALLPTAIQHGDVAVELDPAGALGWYALARAEVLWTRDWPRAEMHYRRAIALDPKAENPPGALAELLVAMGRTNEALEQSDTSLASNPRSISLLRSAAVVHYLAGEYGGALRLLDRARQAGATGPDVDIWLARTRAALGSLDEAAAAAQNAAAAGGPSWAIGFVRALAGQRQEAEQVLADIGKRATQSYVPALEFAYVRAALGQRDEALAFVGTSVREHSPGSEWLLVDPIFAGLRGDPRFRAALDGLKPGGQK
jgi:tetratricopeptide (TPR) repeat protein